MAKKSTVERQKKRVRLAQKYAAKKQALQNQIAKGTPEEAWEARLAMQAIPRNAHVVRQRNRCQLTGRPRGVYRRFGICRIKIRELFSAGAIPGMRKSSW
jgi:small subunit ribosomal protein S14